MRQCIVIGRIIPERAVVRFGPVNLGFKYSDVAGSANIFAEYSQISVHLNFDNEYSNHFNIVAIAKSVAAPIANYLAFSITAAYQLEFDLIVDVNQQRHFPISVSEPFFSQESEPPNTFLKQQEHAPILVPSVAILNPAAERALEELANALRRPHLSPMYCRLAIETLRTSFDSEKETAGWYRMRDALNIRRETIDTFWRLAADQRHGKRIELDWEKRKSCLRIAWEITNRFILYHGDPTIKFETL